MIKLGDEDKINFSVDVELNQEAIEKLHKAEMESMGKGDYNALAMKRDGYLSIENCWKPKDCDCLPLYTDETMEHSFTTISEMYFINNFMLPQDDAKIANWELDRHIEKFLEMFNKYPEIHMNKITLYFLVSDFVELTDSSELDLETNKDSGLTGTYEGCDIVLEDQFCDYGVMLV